MWYRFMQGLKEAFLDATLPVDVHHRVETALKKLESTMFYTFAGKEAKNILEMGIKPPFKKA
ncbi:MAG: hypothetical protein HQM16_01735 [Deltaproteobacteria bacterium]|nr:hypothetical protein [Deltaproteobacteria bacterium]